MISCNFRKDIQLCCFYILFCFYGEVFYPSVFLIVSVYGWDLYELIQADYEVDGDYGKFEYEGCDQA